MKITAHDLKELDVVDDIIPEFGGADEDALSSIGNYMKGNMKKFLEKESKLTKDQLLEERYKRFRKFYEDSWNRKLPATESGLKR